MLMVESITAPRDENAMGEKRTYAPPQFNVNETPGLFDGLTLLQLVNAQELVSQDLRAMAVAREKAGVVESVVLNEN